MPFQFLFPGSSSRQGMTNLGEVTLGNLFGERSHHCVAHLAGAHLGGAFRVDVCRAQATGQNRLDGRLDVVSGLVLVE